MPLWKNYFKLMRQEINKNITNDLDFTLTKNITKTKNCTINQK